MQDGFDKFDKYINTLCNDNVAFKALSTPHLMRCKDYDKYRDMQSFFNG